jgi:hypothetical protein
MSEIVKYRSVSARSVAVRSVAARGVALALSLCVGASSIVCVPASARAADSASSERAEARRLVVEGDGFYAKQSYAQALERYAEAYRIVHVPTVGIEVVKAQQALGQLLEAAQTAREVSALAQLPGEPAVFDQARLQAAREVLALSERTPSLLLDVAPRGVLFVVQIDGLSPSGQTPFPLNPGVHHLRVSADGYQDLEQDVALQEAERQTLSVTLSPLAGAAGSPASAAGASSVGTTSAAADAAASPALPTHLESEAGSSRRTLGWVGVAVAGVGVVAGTFAGIRAFQTKPDCPNDVCSPSQRDGIQTSQRMGYIADVSFGLAIVSGVLGIWALASSAGHAPQSAARAARARLAAAAEPRRGLAVTSVDLGPGTMQLRLSGSF